MAFNGEPQFHHYNPIGMVHAGFAAALLDSAVASAVHSTLAKGETYTTLELKLNLVHALTSRIGTVRAERRVIHRHSRYRGRRPSRQGGQTLRPRHHDLPDFSGAYPCVETRYSLIEVRIMPRSAAGRCAEGAETSSRGLRRVKSQ